MEQKELLFLKIFVFDEFRGPLKGALLDPKGPYWTLRGPKGLKAVVLVIET